MTLYTYPNGAAFGRDWHFFGILNTFGYDFAKSLLMRNKKFQKFYKLLFLGGVG
jgi:uncharacterized protein YllA (UPF0747 family)